MADSVWGQELFWVCPECGFKILDCEMYVYGVMSDDLNDFSTCPVCGTENIIPREYW